MKLLPRTIYSPSFFYLFVFALCVVPWKGYAHTVNPSFNEESQRTLTKHFATKDNVRFTLINKYGNVSITPWEKDSVVIHISVSTYGKTESAAEKLMERVDFAFSNSPSFVRAETVLNQRTNPFEDLINTLTDQSMALFSKSQIEVHYQVYVPRKAALDVQNRFGDLTLGIVKGACDVQLAHGTLRAEALEGPTEIELNFCSADLGLLREGSLKLRGSSVDIKETNLLKINSFTSTIFIEKAEEIFLTSKNDKFECNQIGRLEGESHFGKVQVNQLRRYADISIYFGNLRMQEVLASFEELYVRSSSSSVRLDFQASAYFSLSAETRTSRLDLPSEFTEVSRSAYNRDRDEEIEGFVGEKKARISKVKIRASSGDARIRLLDSPK